MIELEPGWVIYMHCVMVGVWIHVMTVQVPGDALACEPSLADIVPGNLWETTFVHLQEVRLSPTSAL